MKEGLFIGLEAINKMRNTLLWFSKMTAHTLLAGAVIFSSFAQKEPLTNDLLRLKKEKKYDSALILLDVLIIDSEKLQNDSLNAQYKLQVGTILCQQHRCKQGVIRFREALRLGRLSNNDFIKGNSKMGIGNFYLFESNFDSAEFYYRSAILDFTNEPEQIINIRYNLAYLFYSQGKIEKAKSEFDDIITIYQERKDSAEIAKTSFNIALTFESLGSFDDALSYLTQSFQFTTDDLLKAKIRRREALIFHQLKKFESSAKLFLQYDSLINDHINRDYASELSELAEKFKTAEIERDNALKQAEIEENRRQLLLLYAFSFLLILASVSTYLFFNQRRKRQKIASEKAIQDLLQNQEMKTTYALLEGQDKERKRIAAELHDNLGSILVTLNMYADTLQSKKSKDIPALAQKIADVAQLANTETRKISHSLDSGMLRHFGLEAAIKQLTEAVSSARKIKFNLSIQTGEISSDASIEIYRIIQELVNNTLKHAQCTKVHLELTHVDHSLSIIYEDNGVGFNPKELSDGMGLKNIQNRAERLDGELTIDSTPGKGSSFIIEIPHL